MFPAALVNLPMAEIRCYRQSIGKKSRKARNYGRYSECEYRPSQEIGNLGQALFENGAPRQAEAPDLSKGGGLAHCCPNRTH